MSEQVLSQDEVDTLLAGVEPTSELVDEETPAAVPTDEVMPYDLVRQDRLLRGPMPTLETVNEQFARTFRQRFQMLTDQVPELTVGKVKTENFETFLASQVIPSNLNIVQVKPLRGKGLIIFEPQLICSLVDKLFGGTGHLPTRFEGRDFSATEKRIISKLVTAFTECYALAWSGIYPIELDYVRSELQPQFAGIATPTEMVVSTRFNIEMGGVTGAVSLCIPYGTLEPIRETLCAITNTETQQKNDTWIRKLTTELENAEIELTAQLANTEITFGDLLNLQVGDFIELDLEEELSVMADRVPFLKCRYGTNENRYAIKIAKFLTGPNELINGMNHG